AVVAIEVPCGDDLPIEVADGGDGVLVPPAGQIKVAAVFLVAPERIGGAVAVEIAGGAQLPGRDPPPGAWKPAAVPRLEVPPLPGVHFSRDGIAPQQVRVAVAVQVADGDPRLRRLAAIQHRDAREGGAGKIDAAVSVQVAERQCLCGAGGRERREAITETGQLEPRLAGDGWGLA